MGEGEIANDYYVKNCCRKVWIKIIYMLNIISWARRGKKKERRRITQNRVVKCRRGEAEWGKGGLLRTVNRKRQGIGRRKPKDEERKVALEPPQA